MGLTKKQKEFYDYISHYIKLNGHSPTQKEMKDHFNLKSFGSVQKYLQYLEKEGLLSNHWNQRRSIEIKNSNEMVEDENYEKIPLLGMVAAGNPILAIESPNHLISVPKHFIKGAHQYFALNVKGDSMVDAGIIENDIVICRSTNDARSGQIVVAVLDGEATLKTLQYQKKKIELLPHNKNYKPIVIDLGQQSLDFSFKIVGVLVGLMRSYA
jgi:repressor LexA